MLVGCVLVPDFIWVCEARRRPDLVGRPAAVVGDPAGRRVVNRVPAGRDRAAFIAE